MALIKCSECGKEISDKAKQCVNCGAPIETDTLVNEKGKVDKPKEVVTNDKDGVNNAPLPNNNENNGAGGVIGAIIVCVVIAVVILFNLGVFDSDSSSGTNDDTETESILTASKLGNTFSTESTSESLYGGTSHQELQFSEDGTVYWGLCYSKTGKCTGLTYTYKKSGLDVTIYKKDGDVQYSCYFNSNSDRTLYCKHSNGYSYSNYSRVN